MVFIQRLRTIHVSYVTTTAQLALEVQQIAKPVAMQLLFYTRTLVFESVLKDGSIILLIILVRSALLSVLFANIMKHFAHSVQ